MNIFGVVETDNYGRDYPAEVWVVGCWLSKTIAEQIAGIINNEAGEISARYWKVVERGYKLQPGFEP